MSAGVNRCQSTTARVQTQASIHGKAMSLLGCQKSYRRKKTCESRELGDSAPRMNLSYHWRPSNMQLINGDFLLSATDLSKHLACRHATSLDLKAARGEIERIYRNDPSIEVLEERGRRHEAAYLAYLRDQGYDLAAEGGGLERTRDAMKSGVG